MKRIMHLIIDPFHMNNLECIFVKSRVVTKENDRKEDIINSISDIVQQKLPNIALLEHHILDWAYTNVDNMYDVEILYNSCQKNKANYVNGKYKLVDINIENLIPATHYLASITLEINGIHDICFDKLISIAEAKIRNRIRDVHVANMKLMNCIPGNGGYITLIFILEK